VRRPPRSIENKKNTMCMKIIFCHQLHPGSEGWNPEVVYKKGVSVEVIGELSMLLEVFLCKVLGIFRKQSTNRWR